jgi:hypothetical protein
MHDDVGRAAGDFSHKKYVICTDILLLHDADFVT